jgi:tetratricopeptide (TPR) repeat protein
MNRHCIMNRILNLQGLILLLLVPVCDVIGQQPVALGPETMADSLNQRAAFYQKKGDYQTALMLLDQSIEYSRHEGLPKPMAHATWGKAAMLFNMTELDAALQALTQLDSLAMVLNDSLMMAESLKIRGNIYYTQASYEKAKTAHLQALKSGGDSLYGHTCNELARDYHALGKMDSVAYFQQQAIVHRMKKGDWYGLAVSYGNMGHFYDMINDSLNADACFDSALSVARKHRFFDLLSWMHQSLSNRYRKQENYKRALNHYEAFHRYSDSLNLQKGGMDFAMERAKSVSALQNQRIQKQEDTITKTNFLLYIFGGLLVVAILVLVIVRLYMKKRQAELKQKLSRFQMNPHFIFNSLNSLQKMILDNDIRGSNKYLTRFSSLMRTTLENSYHELVSLQSEIEHLNLYLELESMRFDHQFNYHIEVADTVNVHALKIPSLLIQPFVENAIWHGLMHKEPGQRDLKIRFQIRDKLLVCEIEDNGIGRQKALEIKAQKSHQPKALGTTITRQRLNLLNTIYKKTFQVIIHDLTDAGGNASGTRVELLMPVIL